ncbi:MAG: glycosyltransferase family 2 protein [Coleofasciculus chthonoplastes F3-SA18-01]|uniref:glycosyltransferase family 2 protein n=1 Tax=Coleofasciculus chthonoplastes TaxID=64178 RepID=UPI0032F9FEB0
MKFSIVITTHNRLTLLKRAMNSALAQTIPCEVIVVDDGSSDGTDMYVQGRRKELLDMGDTRLIYHRHATTLGHSGTVNQGVALATGNWVKLVDDDDYLAPNCIEEMVKAIAGRPDAVICSCRAIQVNENENEISRSRQVGKGTLLYIPQDEIHYAMLLELLPFGTPVQVAFSRSAFLKSGGWDTRFDTNYDDIDSWIKIAKFGDAIFINKCLACRTVWTGSFNSKFTVEKRLEMNLIIKEKIYFCISEKYRHSLPKLSDIKSSIRLHWGFVALKKIKIISALKIYLKTDFSMAASRLFIKRLVARDCLDKLLKESQENTLLFVRENR